jgi:PAS domain S-box-containing protein
MTDQHHAIMLVEDNLGDARLLRELLREAAGDQFELSYANRLSVALHDLAPGGIDAVLLDLALPDSEGLDTLDAVRAIAPHVPIVVLTGLVDESVAIQAMRAGAQDYLIKGQVDGRDLARALRYAIERQRTRTQLEAATAALRESEARNRAVLGALTAHIAMLDGDGMIVTVNAAWNRFARANGGTEFGETNNGTNYLTVCRAAAAAGDTLAATAATGIESVLVGKQSYFMLEYPCHAPDEERWFVMHVTPLDEHPGVVVAHENVSERKRAEQSLRQKTTYIQLLQDVAVAANQATSIDEALQTTIDQICLRLGWQVGHAYIASDGEVHTLVSADIWHLSEPGRFATFQAITEAIHHVPLDDLPGRVLVSGQPQSIPDITTAAKVTRARVISDLGVCAGFAFPVLVGAEVAAVLEFFASEPCEPDAALLDMMAHVGAQLGRVIERSRAKQALSASEERYRLIAENTNDLIEIFDQEGRFVYASPSHRQVLGIDPAELIDSRVSDLIHSDDRTALELRQISLPQPPWMPHAAFRARHADDSWRWLDASLTETSQQGNTYFVCVARDITERRSTEKQLRRLAHAVEQSASTIVITDTHGQIEYANPAISKTTGYPVEEALGRHMRMFRSGHTSPEEYRRLWETIASGNEWRGEFLNKKKNGELFWESAVISPIKNVEGVITNYLAVKEDITARKRVQEQLTESERKLRLAVEAANVGLWDWNLRSNSVYYSPEWKGQLGYSDTEIADSFEEWQSRVHPDDLDRALSVIAAYLQNPWPRYEQTFRMQHKDGTYRWLLAQASVLMDETNAPYRMLGSHVDITERKQVEEALVEERALLARRVEERTADLSIANAELARAARLKDEFLASMSHELRTPLNAVLGLSEALREESYGPLNNDQDRALATIAESGQHLLDLINDILDLARIGASKMELQLEPVAVATVCEASLRLVKQAAVKKQITVELMLDPAVDTLCADGRRLKQILVNLLSNAVKFTAPGGRVGLEVRGDTNRQTVDLTVWDTGIGIAGEHLDRLFQPFVQIDSRLARQYGGTGLGLALVYRMTEMHGGGVAVSSEIGTGSRFTISLPWVTDQRPSLNVHDDADAEFSSSFRDALIVEDSPAAAMQVARYLGELGIVTTVIDHGHDVLIQAAEMQPDLILLDILLPDTSGWDVLTKLKADPRTQAIPVVILSVLDEPVRGMELGAASYLVKPCTRDELQSMLRQIGVSKRSDLADSHKVYNETDSPLILLAEDNEANIVTLGDYLANNGYRVVVARSGVEAVASAQERRPDLILMDIQMPGMDGLEATRRIRAHTDMAGTPIIALTALAMPGDRERCLEAGMNDYVSKPVGLKQLAANITAHLHSA